ncbi:MAG: BlaI/MecI/CopY family transcriptional regulator [Sedimentisphaerales bacterium]|nr:BlaI/MecI/CopY family transcriptional regulator [Sedimentisphaerales bacterium]
MVNKILKSMSPTETEILRLVWELKEATVQQIRELLPSERKLAYNTVQTLLSRLEQKGYLNHRLEGKAHVYGPAIKQRDVIKTTVSDFLSRLFGGDPKPLVQFLAEDGKIDEDDINRLRELINKSKNSK